MPLSGGKRATTEYNQGRCCLNNRKWSFGYSNNRPGQCHSAANNWPNIHLQRHTRKESDLSLLSTWLTPATTALPAYLDICCWTKWSRWRAVRRPFLSLWHITHSDISFICWFWLNALLWEWSSIPVDIPKSSVHILSWCKEWPRVRLAYCCIPVMETSMPFLFIM